MTRPEQAAAVDVCVPVYNAAGFLHETIESILSQDFTDFRLLLSVDASDDNSLAICKDYARDSRVSVYEHRQRLGFVGNTNFLMQTARSKFMKFAPHDDILAPGMLRRLHDFMRREPDCSVAIPMIEGFGEEPLNFAQHEVRGPRFRRLLDVIMNQRPVAAFHGLVRISSRAGPRPMVPKGFHRDHEADVHWMAMAARNGELRVVRDAVVNKRFRPGMKSLSWRPETHSEAHRLLVQHTARLTEYTWPFCSSDAERRQLIMAAWARLWGLGLNWGVMGSNRSGIWSRCTLTLRLLKSLPGPPAELARRQNFFRLVKQVSLDDGVVGASWLARQVEHEALRGRTIEARRLFRQAIVRDPHAGWAEPFRREFPGLAGARLIC
jgi:glycosyltransferase involved in cell wall biosynthesis